MHFGCISKINVKNVAKQLKNSKGSASSMHQFILEICKIEGDANYVAPILETNIQEEHQDFAKLK
jgi:hypothetical protein